jgi:cell division protein FtsQ
MSPGGRWRAARAGLRTAFGLALLGALGWSGWWLYGALQDNPRRIPAAVRAIPVKPPELETDGVLDRGWLDRTLRLRPGASLMELDLDALRLRLLADGKVLTASVTRRFPDRLLVRLTERTPVARVMAELDGSTRPLLVARDGVVFAGEGHDLPTFDSLPWLDGIALVRRGTRFQPIPGMGLAAELLAKAQLEAEHLYRTWHVVSLARLESDREIEVRTPSGATIVFGADADFFIQLARLDFVWARLNGQPGTGLRIDLSLGREVPVMLDPLAARERAAPPPAGSLLLHLNPTSHREF